MAGLGGAALMQQPASRRPLAFVVLQTHAPGAHAVFPPRFLKIGFAVCSIEVSNLAWPLR